MANGSSRTSISNENCPSASQDTTRAALSTLSPLYLVISKAVQPSALSLAFVVTYSHPAHIFFIGSSLTKC